MPVVVAESRAEMRTTHSRALAAVAAVFGTAAAVQYIASSSLGQDISTSSLLTSLAFASPMLVPAWRGHFGVEVGRYPSSWFLIIALWTLSLGPSLVANDTPLRLLFIYDELSQDLGRLLFFVWNWLFVLACPENVHLVDKTTKPNFPLPQYITVLAVWSASIATLAQAGHLSNYTGSDSREAIAAGGVTALAITYKPLTDILPALALYQFLAGPPKYRWLAVVVCLAALAVLMVIGGRTHLVVAAMALCGVANSQQVRLRLPVVLGAGAIIGLMLVMMFASRSSVAQLSTASTTNILEAISTSISQTANESERSNEVLQQVGDNVALRFGYAPQLYAAISSVLADGPAYRGTLFEGPIRMLPSVLFPWKNSLADEVALEPALWATGHFPIVDLGPTPWLQWFFELGFPWVLCGPVVYVALMRMIQSFLKKNDLLWLTVGLMTFNAIVSIEHQTDTLFILARDMTLLVIVMRLSDVFDRKPKTVA